MANIGMNFYQAATILNQIVSQATGATQIVPTNTNEFVSVAQTGLNTGYDPLMSAINQVLTKTIFSTRPYSAKFKGLMMDAQRYGNHVRKLQLADNTFEEDDRIKLTEGNAMDQQVVKKPKALQTNFYGESVFEDHITIFKDQLDVAFSGPEEFGQFISMVMQNMTDRLEKAREELARMTLANFIAGKSKCDSTNVIYLLDAYYSETGTSVTAQSVKNPTNFAPFAKWLFGYLKTVSDLMTERSYKFHKNFTIAGSAFNIARHTPINRQKIYLYSKELNNIDTSVLSSTFHTEYLNLADHERVNYWQAIDNPMAISATPGYSDTDGTQVSSPSEVTLNNVFGVIFDEEAVGYSVVNQWSAPAPFNARGGYTNYWFHETRRYFNDFTENGVVLILDHAETGDLGLLTLTSAAGASSGKTAITVSPAKAAGNSYKYIVDDARTVVLPGQTVGSDWSSWDGSADITAATNKILTLVELNGSSQVVKAGYVKVTAKA